MVEMERERRMQRRVSKWELSVKALKLTTGGILVVVAAIILLFSIIHLAETAKIGDTTHAFEVFISDVLLVVIMLEVAKTLFTYVENEGMYLHSIMEVAFIAVLRQVILTEINGINWSDTIGLAVLLLTMGFVYYRLFEAPKEGPR